MDETAAKSEPRMVRLVLVRPRSRRFAHMECIAAAERESWVDRLRFVPAVDAAMLKPCLLCNGSLDEPSPRITDELA